MPTPCQQSTMAAKRVRVMRRTRCQPHKPLAGLGHSTQLVEQVSKQQHGLSVLRRLLQQRVKYLQGAIWQTQLLAGQPAASTQLGR